MPDLTDEQRDRLVVTEQSRDRWRDRAKRAQNELSDLRAAIGLSDNWTADDSIGVYRHRAEAAEARHAALVAAVEGLLAEGPDAWTPYDSRDTGETFLAESVLDFTRDLRTILADHRGQA